MIRNDHHDRMDHIWKLSTHTEWEWRDRDTSPPTAPRRLMCERCGIIKTDHWYDNLPDGQSFRIKDNIEPSCRDIVVERIMKSWITNTCHGQLVRTKVVWHKLSVSEIQKLSPYRQNEAKKRRRTVPSGSVQWCQTESHILRDDHTGGWWKLEHQYGPMCRLSKMCEGGRWHTKSRVGHEFISHDWKPLNRLVIAARIMQSWTTFGRKRTAGSILVNVVRSLSGQAGMLTSQSLKMNLGVHKRNRIVTKFLQYESASRSWTNEPRLGYRIINSFYLWKVPDHQAFGWWRKAPLQ